VVNIFDLTGRTAIVTGGGRGIGRATAIVLAQAGANVVVASRTLPELDTVVQEIASFGGKALAVRTDVTLPADIQQMVDKTVQVFGTVDILVNNAGWGGSHGMMQDTTVEDWDAVQHANLRSAFLCAKAVFPLMHCQQRGSIVNIASISGQTGGLSARVHYAASKGGMIAFTKALARQMAPWGRANSIAPGQIDTGMGRIPPERLRIVLEQTLLGRLGRPEEIAYGVLFLASDAASFLTGHTLNINGGLLMD